eukprot:UN02840
MLLPLLKSLRDQSEISEDGTSATPTPPQHHKQQQSIVEKQPLSAHQLIALRTQLQQSFDDFFEELLSGTFDLQYTFKNVFDTLAQWEQLDHQGFLVSSDGLFLRQCADVAVQYQLHPDSPLGTLNSLGHPLPIDPKLIASILDQSPFTVFTGMDCRFFSQFLLTVPKMRVLLAKTLQVANQAKSRYTYRLLGVILQLLPFAVSDR